MQIVGAGADHVPFLERMWHVAAFWQPEVFVLPPEEAMEVPELSRYIAGWGRSGDAALVAVEDGQPLGAAWYRLFTVTAPGYGFVAEDVPEVAVGVEQDHRGRGIGTALLGALLARAEADGFRAVSLSVSEGNPSRRIYQRLGFVDLSHEDGSYVMLCTLDAGRG